MVVSSVASEVPLAGNIVYSAGKSFASFIAMGLNYELRDKVDVLAYHPGEVATKLLGK